MPNGLTPSNPVAALVDLSLDAVALCNAGANSRADILLRKRKETKSMPKTFEELLASLTPEASETVTKHIEGLMADNTAKIASLEEQVNKAAKSTPAPAASTEPSADDVLKNADPAIKEYFEKMQGQMQQLLDAQANELVEKRYQLCKAIPVEEAELREVLKSASPKVIEVLTKAANAISESLLKAKGTDASGQIVSGNSDDAYNVLEKRAKAIAVEKGITFEKAFTVACSEAPDTYKKYVEGVK